MAKRRRKKEEGEKQKQKNYAGTKCATVCPEYKVRKVDKGEKEDERGPYNSKFQFIHRPWKHALVPICHSNENNLSGWASKRHNLLTKRECKFAYC